MEDDFLLDAEDDVKAVEFIKNYLPQDMKDKFTDEDLYYILDLIAEYYTSSECLDAEPDEEGYIDIDLDEIVKYIVKEAKKDGMGPYESDDVFFVVQGEMEYADTLEEEKKKKRQVPLFLFLDGCLYFHEKVAGRCNHQNSQGRIK